LLDTPDNPDAEPPCPHTHSALIVFGRNAGHTVTICTESDCPVHDPATAARLAREQAEHPAPVMAPAPENETEEEAQARKAEFEQQRREYEAERARKAAERQAELERQQKEYEAEVKRHEKEYKARLATLERIVAQAPALLHAAQLRFILELLIERTSYGAFEEAAQHFAQDEEKTETEILSEALSQCTEEHLAGFLLRLLLSEHAAIPRHELPDWLAKAEVVFATQKPQRKRTNRQMKINARKQSTNKDVA
jgi:ParB family chromosome partitioning protein